MIDASREYGRLHSKYFSDSVTVEVTVFKDHHQRIESVVRVDDTDDIHQNEQNESIHSSGKSILR